MRMALKPINEQALVITGASSGIGLATAQMAAARGARVLLVSRDETDLEHATQQIQVNGGLADYFVADVADRQALEAAAQHALTRFGRIDTWVNNAGVSIYGRIAQVSEADARRLFDTNYWGVVNGALVAIPHLRTGGVLVNIGSVLSDTSIPLQGHYTASKHAVKGFTDVLRMEVEQEGLPVRVSLVKPGPIDTPYPQHAKNYMPTEPTHAPPVYAPELVAEAIIACAEKGLRDVKVGDSTKLFTAMETFVPRLADRFKERTMFENSVTDEPAHSADTLHAPRPNDGRVRGTYRGHVFTNSPYSAMQRNPTATLLGVAALGVGLFAARGFLTRPRS